MPAALATLRRTGIGPLTVTAATLLVILAAVYPPRYVEGLFGFVVLPLGGCVLAMIAWSAQVPAWRIVLARATRPREVQWALLGLLAALVVGMCLLTGLLMVLGGTDPGRAAAQVAVGIPLGWASVTLTLYLHTRLHLAVALCIAVLGLLTGVLFGGSSLATTWLWLAGPAGWFVSATGTGRIGAAVALSLLTTALSTAAWIRATGSPKAVHQR